MKWGRSGGAQLRNKSTPIWNMPFTIPNSFLCMIIYYCDQLYNFLKDEIWNFVLADEKIGKFSKAKYKFKHSNAKYLAEKMSPLSN